MNDTDREAIRELNIAQAEAEEDDSQWAMQMREVLRQRMEGSEIPPMVSPIPPSLTPLNLDYYSITNKDVLINKNTFLKEKSKVSSLQGELLYLRNKLNEHLDKSKKRGQGINIIDK